MNPAIVGVLSLVAIYVIASRVLARGDKRVTLRIVFADEPKIGVQMERLDAGVDLLRVAELYAKKLSWLATDDPGMRIVQTGLSWTSLELESRVAFINDVDALFSALDASSDSIRISYSISKYGREGISNSLARNVTDNYIGLLKLCQISALATKDEPWEPIADRLRMLFRFST